MFASNSRDGLVVIAWATQATFQMLNAPSPGAVRPSRPKPAASGHVITMESPTAAAESSAARVTRRAALSGPWTTM
jgi:hypothetical protein